MSEARRLAEQLDSQEFYELMQAYRNAPIVKQSEVIHAFEDIKRWILERASHLQPAPGSESDEQVVWFHGTSPENAAEIARTGFKEGTWFARHMEDAVEFGGPIVLSVKVAFDAAPMKWQVCASNAIPASAIIRRHSVCCEMRELPAPPQPAPARNEDHHIHCKKQSGGKCNCYAQQWEPAPATKGEEDWQPRMDNSRPLHDGEPCGHPGCLRHISHPCEGCGRIGGVRAGAPEEKGKQ